MLQPYFHALAFSIAAVLVCVPVDAWASARRPDAQPAQSALTEDDLDAIQDVIGKMGTAFLNGSAKAMKGVLTESIERDAIVATLRREFQQAKYFDFQFERPIADNSISDIRHSVDVTIRVKLLYLDDSRPEDSRLPIENTTFQSFIVQRELDGSFTIVNSSFFDNMGRRDGGGRLFVHVLAALMVFCALLAFWVWMASEAWWIRPRSVLWRVSMILPPLGPLVFFCVRYLPEKLRRKKK